MTLPQTRRDGRQIRIFSTARNARDGSFYAKYVTRGTAPHLIRPRTKPRLRFYWIREGRMFIGNPGQAVRHPGTRPNNFIKEALHRGFRR